MSEALVRRVALAAVKGERGSGGWLKVDAPKATEKEISLAVMAAQARGLVEACDVSSHNSDYPEWKLTGPTGNTQRYIHETRGTKKLWGWVVSISVATVAFLAWLIPVLISLWKGRTP